MNRKSIVLAAACGVAIAIGSASAIAGPCSDQIAALGKKLSENPALGPATTGALAGSGPQANLKPVNGSATPNLAQQQAGTSATNKLGGTGGTKEMNAASTEVATSPQDVRRQQAGLPTMATDPQAKLTDQQNKISEAKMDLAQARALDQKNDAACQTSLAEAQKLAD